VGQPVYFDDGKTRNRCRAAAARAGFFPPLMMGAIFGLLDDYSWGLALLAATAALAGLFTIIAFGRSTR
jgi:MFS transporter, NNP family, nitrate/nitrite transporter